MARSDKYTALKKQEYYSDFLINFDVNPITGVLARSTNEDSIKQALKNLLLTNYTERFYDTLIGSRINSLLFEPFSIFTALNLKDEIQTTIKNNEPRVIINDISVTAKEDENGYLINIIFSTINIAQTTNLELFLQRVR
jgi:phage baseplate assembly protein W